MQRMGEGSERSINNSRPTRSCDAPQVFGIEAIDADDYDWLRREKVASSVNLD